MATAVLTEPGLVPRHRFQKVGVAFLLLVGALATAAAAVFGNGNPGLALAPVVFAVGAYWLWVSPIRYPLFGLILLCLTLDGVGEGMWSSPLSVIGGPLLFNLNKVMPIGALAFPGMAVIMFVLLGLLIHRTLAGITLDTDGRGPVPSSLIKAMAVGVLTIVVVVSLGMIRAGDSQMAKIQVQSYLLMLLMAYLASMSLRGVADYRILGRIIIAAALYRTVYVAYVYHVVAPRLGGPPGVAATHGDSLLFAAATVLLLIRFLEKPSMRTAGWCAMLMPFLLLGIQWNNRRLVWVEIAAGMLVYLVISRRSRMKSILAYAVMLALPLIIGYIAIGWNSQSKIFAPIKMYRSVTDGQVDSSTLYRDLENYNLMMTMRVYPLTGMGFGQTFLEEVVLPDISGLFREYRYMPHNSILGLWAFAGPLGFTGIWLTVVLAVYFAGRAYPLARSPDERVACMMVVSIVAIYLSHCWGDIGFSELRTIYIVGPVLAMAGQLACATGAWRIRSVKSV
jgi:hypothetical protein